jgi:tetratricopeptide (TPR) repeat protein
MKVFIKFSRSSFVLLLVITLAAFSQQRQDVDIKFKLAQSHERAGNYEAAVKLYEELFSKDSSNVILFEALKRTYLQLKRNDDAIALIERRLSFAPQDVGLLAQLGSIYLRISDEPKAVSAWERAIAVDPQNETVYRIVASAMIESRAFERAIETYKRGREANNNPSLFTSDLAYLYGILLNYAEATREYLSLLRESPSQLGYVQSRLVSFTSRPEGLSSVRRVVEQASRTDANNTTLLYLLSWVYMEGKQYDKAFDVIKRIDHLTNAGGREIFNFAERALKDKVDTIAIDAYQTIIKQYPSFPQISQAKFGYARALEDVHCAPETLRLFGIKESFSGERPATESEPVLNGVIAAYQRVISEHPYTEIAARSLLRIAYLHYQRFFNLDAAQQQIHTIVQKYGNFIPVVIEAKIFLSEILIASNNLDAAEKLLQELSSARFVSLDQLQTIAFRSAEVAYFRGNFQDAIERLNNLTKQLTTDIANDAIDLQIFLQENMAHDEKSLKEFARAELLHRQRKLSEALLLLSTILQSSSSSSLKEYASMRMGDIYAQMKRYDDAIASYESLAQSFPESVLLDRMLMNIGHIYQTGLHDKAKAIAAYQKILETYPQSLYVNEARKRIRELRGDTL